MIRGLPALLARFIELRNLDGTVVDVACPERIGGFGLPGRCYINAREAANRFSHLKLVSGWLYLRLNRSGDRQFTQHWWNIDLSSGQHVDFSPGIETGAVHLVDDAIALYVEKNRSRLTSHVGASVLHRGGKFFLVTKADDGSLSLEPSENLDTKTLFSHYHLK